VIARLISAVLIVSFAGGGKLQDQPSPPSSEEHQQARQRLRVKDVAQKLLVSRVAPVYPKDLRKQRIQGMVKLSVGISKDGNVIDAKLISGHPGLGQAAIDAVRQWKFKPYLLNGQAVEIETEIWINFSLANG
jgi:TonB family protein